MKRIQFNSLVLIMAIAACKGSSGAKGVPHYGTPELSDFGTKNYLINSVEEQSPISGAEDVRRLSENVKDSELCSQTLNEEQLYNPYRHLSLRSSNWILEKNVEEVDYVLRPTRFNHIRVNYWSKIDAQGNAGITRLTSDCYAPSAWATRSSRLELGVHSFVKKYSDCLQGGLPDVNAIDDCQDGYESIGGLVHRIKSTVLNRHRFRVTWWLKKPDNFDFENAKIKEALKIPHRIPLEFNSLYSELSENDAYRVRALGLSEVSAPDFPTYWLISDDAGRNREFLPLNGVEVLSNLEPRAKLKEISRANSVANFSGHFAWDRSLRMQRRSSQLPVSRFYDDHVHGLFKKLRNGTSLKVHIVYRANDIDDVFLEEFLLDSEGNLTFKKIKQLNAYGMTTMGLPDSTRDLDANGLEIYND